MTPGAGASEELRTADCMHARRTSNSVCMGLIVGVWLLSDVAIESRLRQVSMKKREKSPCQVEFSEERVELVNDGCQQQTHTYQLQNRGPGSVRVRAAIGADSDPVSTPSSRLHNTAFRRNHVYTFISYDFGSPPETCTRCLRAFGYSDWKALLSYKPVLRVVSCRCLFC